MPLFFILFAFALAVPVLWPGADLWASGLFYRDGQGFFLADNPILVALHWLAYFGARALGVVFAAMAMMTRMPGRFGRKTPPLPNPPGKGEGISLCLHSSLPDAKGWLFLLLALLVGPALIANAGFKDHWGRARPRQITEFGGAERFSPALIPQAAQRHNGSFVCGDGAFGFFLPSFGYVAPRRRARRAFWGGMVAGGVLSFARLAMGAHFLSDIFYAAAFMLAASAALHAALYGRKETAARWRDWFMPTAP